METVVSPNGFQLLQDVQEEGEIVEDEEEHLPVDSLVGTDLHKEENVGIGDKTESQRQGQVTGHSGRGKTKPVIVNSKRIDAGSGDKPNQKIFLS